MATKNTYQIVLIEDNPMDTQVLQQAFDEVQKPYKLEVLANGDEVTRFLENGAVLDGAAPSLILLDLHLPKCDGVTILEQLRSYPVLSKVPVVVLSTMASPQEQKKVIEMGARMYCMKPMGWNETVSLAGDFLNICQEGCGQ